MHSPPETLVDAVMARGDVYARKIRVTKPESRGVFINATEVYLFGLYTAYEEGSPPNRHSLARRLGISRSAVGQMIERMVRAGLVDLVGQRGLHLTAEGTAQAVSIVRKHRLAERLLVDVVGFDRELAHLEASRLQHVLGTGVERKLIGLLHDPRRSHLGCPIPGLELLDPTIEPLRGPNRGTRSIAEMARLGIDTGVVSHFSEHVQDDVAVIRDLTHAGVLPQKSIAVEPRGRPDDIVRVISAGSTLTVSARTAELIIVDCAEG